MAMVYFTPDEDVTVEEDDADYLHYGFWLKKTADADGAVTYNEVETFAGSTVGDRAILVVPTGPNSTLSRAARPTKAARRVYMCIARSTRMAVA